MTLGNTKCSKTLAKQTNECICCCDMIKLWIAKIKGGLIKECAICQIFFAKEQRKALKGKCDENL